MADLSDWLRPRLRAMQVIALCLPAGAIVFTTIMLFHRLNDPQPAPDEPFLSYFAVGFAALMFSLSFVVPALVRNAKLKQMASLGVSPTPEQLIALYHTTLIIGLALLEAPAFFCIIAYVTDGEMWVLIGVLIAVSLMALRLPTEMSVLAWLNETGERVEKLRRVM